MKNNTELLKNIIFLNNLNYLIFYALSFNLKFLYYDNCIYYYYLLEN